MIMVNFYILDEINEKKVDYWIFNSTKLIDIFLSAIVLLCDSSTETHKYMKTKNFKLNAMDSFQ